MKNKFKKILLFLAFSWLILCPNISFAWRDDYYYGDWDYSGSGRDHPYSYYIDHYYNPGYADYPMLGPGYIDATYIKNMPAPAAQPDELFTVNIPNKQGGYTAVIIKRSGNGFTGPQGEYYPEFPKIFQLEIMYGK